MASTYSAFTTGFKLSNKMDDFSNHLSAKDASRNSKNAAWGGTFAQPKVWVSFFIKCCFENLNLEKFKLLIVFKMLV